MQKRGVFQVAFALLLLASLAGNVVLYAKTRPTEPPPLPAFNDDQLMANISLYLDQISAQYVDEVQQIASGQDSSAISTSWGCGPSSYALAKILDKKFFDDRLPIVPSYENHPYEIVERFGLAHADPAVYHGDKLVDHAWLEIYFKNKFLYIDPTVGQFGKYKIIAHESFQVGDSTVSDTLGSKYGLVDVRLRRVVQKAIDRVPNEQEPYPGIGIDPSDLPYFQQIIEDRNVLESGKEPDSWSEWTDKLLPDFLKSA